MKELKSLTLVFLVALSLSGCDSDSENCTGDKWLNDKIESLSGDGQSKAEIVHYRYQSQTVYLVDVCLDCSDAMQIVYSCTGKKLCTFGGIGGLNTCPNFFETATDKKVIWHN